VIYVPIIKNRTAEIRALKICADFLCEEIIPYFEIINDQYKPRHEVDSKGEKVYELKPGNKKKTPKKAQPLPEDICTLEKINEAVVGNRCFIEYFRYSEDDYPDSKINLKKVELARELSNDYAKYVEKIIDVCRFEKFIPVISIKKSFAISNYDLKELVDNIRKKGNALGVRVQIDLLDDYMDFLEQELNEADFLFVDIGEKPYVAQEFLLQDIADYSINATCILINSPRHKKDVKREYQIDGWEPLINNIVAIKYADCGFDGFGDYAGLKDNLPEDIPVQSYTLALIYEAKENKFWSIRSQIIGDAMEVKKIALLHASEFDPDGDCYAYKEINRIDIGNQANWNTITVVRYIDQMSKRLHLR
jgi:hypothetical protein